MPSPKTFLKRQSVYWRKRLRDHRMLWRTDSSDARRADEGLQIPGAGIDAVSRTLSRLDSRVQGRRAGVFELLGRGAFRRVDAARDHCVEVRRKTRMGRGPYAHHE